MREYEQFLSSTEQSLHQQTEQLIALGRQASGGQTDACVGVGLAGGKMALKARQGGIDFDGRVIAKLAVVVIPTGSPVPLVQRYDTPFQPAGGR